MNIANTTRNSDPETRMISREEGFDRSNPTLYATEEGWVSILPHDLKDAMLENCPDLPEKLVKMGYEWATHWPPKSMFIHGAWGSGKTWFSYACIRQLIRSLSGKGYFWPTALSGKELDNILVRASRSPEGDLERIKILSQEQLLFIDEIEKVSRLENGDVSSRLKYQFFEIVNRRMLSKLPTIITSNLSLTELGNIIDGSLVSRMGNTELWAIIKFPNKDLRQSVCFDFSQEIT